MRKANAAVGKKRDPVLGKGRPKTVGAQTLESGPVMGRHGASSVKAKTLDIGAEGLVDGPAGLSIDKTRFKA